MLNTPLSIIKNLVNLFQSFRTSLHVAIDGVLGVGHFAAPGARVAAVRGEVLALQVVLGRVLVAEPAVAYVAEVAAPGFLPSQVVVRQDLQVH